MGKEGFNLNFDFNEFFVDIMRLEGHQIIRDGLDKYIKEILAEPNNNEIMREAITNMINLCVNEKRRKISAEISALIDGKEFKEDAMEAITKSVKSRVMSGFDSLTDELGPPPY